MMNQRYHGLRLIGLILKIAGGTEISFAILALVLFPLILSNSDAALIQLGLPISTPGTGLLIGIVAGVVFLFVGVVTGLLTFALGELINVEIAIEENTRAKLELDKRNNDKMLDT
jgi:hypothetical protein